jgi:hypothetical protein
VGWDVGPCLAGEQLMSEQVPDVRHGQGVQRLVMQLSSVARSLSRRVGFRGPDHRVRAVRYAQTSDLPIYGFEGESWSRQAIVKSLIAPRRAGSHSRLGSITLRQSVSSDSWVEVTSTRPDGAPDSHQRLLTHATQTLAFAQQQRQSTNETGQHPATERPAEQWVPMEMSIDGSPRACHRMEYGEHWVVVADDPDVLVMLSGHRAGWSDIRLRQLEPSQLSEMH